MLRSAKSLIISVSRFVTILFGIGALLALVVTFFSGYVLPKHSLQLHASAVGAVSFDPYKLPHQDFSGPVFSDVPEDYRHAYALFYLKKKGVLKGFEDGSFKPDEILDRGGLMKLMTSSRDLYPHQIRYSHCFTDVNGEWFAPHICYGKAQGWVGGDGAFYPLDGITRAEGLKIMMATFGVDEGTIRDTRFGDVEKESWYAPYVATAERRGWLRGFFEGEFKADEVMTRSEVGELLFRIMITEE